MTLTEFLLARIAEDGAMQPSHAEMLRRVVRLHDRAFHQCVADDEPTLWRTRTNPCDTLRMLALPYADHPDFRDEEWQLAAPADDESTWGLR